MNDIQRNEKITLAPTLFGRGLLNAKHAFLYAHLLDDFRKNNPEIAPDDESVKYAYTHHVQLEEKRALNTIRKGFFKKANIE